MSIKNQILLAIFISVLVPVSMIAVITISEVTKRAESSFKESSQLQLSTVSFTFETYFNEMSRILVFLSELNIVRDSSGGELSTYFTGEKEPGIQAKQSNEREKRLFELFETLGSSNVAYSYVYMGDKTGGYVEWPGKGVYTGWDSRDRPFYKLGMGAPGEIVYRNAYYWEPIDAALLSLVRSYENPRGAVEGVVAIDVSLDSLTTMAGTIQVGQTGYVMIIEDNGNVLVDGKNPENVFKNIQDIKNKNNVVIQGGDSRERERGLVEFTANGTDFVAFSFISDRLGWQFVTVIEKSEVFASARSMTWVTVIVAVLLVMLFSGIGAYYSNTIVKRINTVKRNLKAIANGNGDLTTRINVTSNDESGELARWFNKFVGFTHGVILTIRDSAEQVNSVAEQTSLQSKEMADTSKEQLDSISQIVTATSEMAATANDVASNCVAAASKADSGMTHIAQGKSIVESSANSAEVLGQRIQEANTVISELDSETDNINNILTTIQNIAEQTNLLALNAAIEAARAGEQGRGFAVVADEVRNLAQRAQESTEEIGNLLSSLVNRTLSVSKTMDASLAESQKTIADSKKALQAFIDIESSVQEIQDMTTMIATATEEQHLVTEEITKNITSVNDAAESVSSVSENLASLCSSQMALSEKLKNLVGNFKLN